jgi:hypothetical protein
MRLAQQAFAITVVKYRMAVALAGLFVYGEFYYGDTGFVHIATGPGMEMPGSIIRF